MHVDPQWIIAFLTFVSVIMIPTLFFLVRGAMKWTHVTDKLDELIIDMKQVVTDKEHAHAELYAQMRADREVTDRRLRFIEEAMMRSNIFKGEQHDERKV